MKIGKITFVGKMGVTYNAKARGTELMTKTNTSNMTRKRFSTGRAQNSWLFTSVAEALNS